jgi:hypothetical protein
MPRWLCGGFETDCATALGVRPNAAGFIDTLEGAQHCAATRSHATTAAPSPSLAAVRPHRVRVPATKARLHRRSQTTRELSRVSPFQANPALPRPSPTRLANSGSGARKGVGVQSSRPPQFQVFTRRPFRHATRGNCDLGVESEETAERRLPAGALAPRRWRRPEPEDKLTMLKQGIETLAERRYLYLYSTAQGE